MCISQHAIEHYATGNNNRRKWMLLCRFKHIPGKQCSKQAISAELINPLALSMHLISEQKKEMEFQGFTNRGLNNAEEILF